MAANLIAPDSLKNGTMDLWNHVKVPRIDSTTFDDTYETPWVTLNKTLESNDSSFSNPYNFTSWTGVNLQNIQYGDRTYFNMEYSYIDLNCTKHLSRKTSVDILANWTRSDMHIQSLA